MPHQGDPHGAAFWLDFLAVKSGNPGWIISMMEESSSWEPASLFKGYPGMAYGLALARRAQETVDKSSVSCGQWHRDLRMSRPWSELTATGPLKK
jgi:hypothetical protein